MIENVLVKNRSRKSNKKTKLITKVATDAIDQAMLYSWPVIRINVKRKLLTCTLP